MATRHALSLMEVVISIALFATLLVAVLETALAVRSVTDQHENLLDLDLEGHQILAQVTRDLSNTTWLDPLPTGRYPLVVPDAFGMGIEFMRIRSATPGTQDSGIAQLDFSRPAARMQDWKVPNALSPVNGLVADENYVTNVGRLVMPVWETTAARNADNLTFAENRTVDNLRIYVYRVEPTISGRGTLRRYYREGDPAGALVRDATLGDLGRNIYSFSAVPRGQSITLILELRRNPPGAPPPPGTPVTPQVSRFQTSIAMRSIN